MFIIKHVNGKFFEQDFFGWSWQTDGSKAYRFKTEEAATTVIEGLSFWADETREDMTVEPII